MLLKINKNIVAVTHQLLSKIGFATGQLYSTSNLIICFYNDNKLESINYIRIYMYYKKSLHSKIMTQFGQYDSAVDYNYITFSCKQVSKNGQFYFYEVNTDGELKKMLQYINFMSLNTYKKFSNIACYNTLIQKLVNKM